MAARGPAHSMRGNLTWPNQPEHNNSDPNSLGQNPNHSASPSGVPGRALLSPSALVAVLVLVVNDHVIKQAWPGVISGKLSDFAYCFLLPLVLISALEWAGWAMAQLQNSPWQPVGKTAWRMACALSSLQFSALQLHPGFAAATIQTLELVLPFWHFSTVSDPTDLIALVMIPLAWRTLRSG